MGKCSKCGKKIEYNSFKRIKGIIYCLGCVPSETRQILDEGKLAYGEFKKDMEEVNKIVIATEKLDFDELKEAMKEPGIIAANEALTKELGEPMKMTISPMNVLIACKYCGAKNSSDWIVLKNGERVCKRPSCRRKLNEYLDEKAKEE